jgi:hypothetical protein
MVELNITAACKYIGKFELFIQMIKECSLALVSDLPYSVLPRQVVIHLVYFAVLWLNSLPAAVGVSEIYSPRKIILGHELDFTKHCITPFGSYLKAHDDPTITNTMHLCTFPGIFLGPTGNRQGTHKVFDINTGAVKKPCTVTLLPMTDRVTKVVNDWGQRHAKEDIKLSLTFLNCKKELYNWDNDNLHRSVLGANRPNSTHSSPTNPYSLTHLVRPMTPMSQKPDTGKISNTTPAPPNLTWADQV